MSLRSFSGALSFGALLCLPVSAGAAYAQSEPFHEVVPASINGHNRLAADQALDAKRKPAELIAFAGITGGNKVADIIPGSGYFTRLFSNAVGKTGHVYAILTPESLKFSPDGSRKVEASAADPAFGNITALKQPAESFHVPEALDVVWTSQNYHDIYYGTSPEAALSFDKAAFAALRPGGAFIVVDHVANKDQSGDIKRLHRINPDLIISQVKSVGFVFEGRSNILAQPEDTHDKPIFDPSIRGRTDQAVLKFRKPA